MLSLYKYKIFPALRFKKESLGRDFCVCGGGGWGVAAWGKCDGFSC